MSESMSAMGRKISDHDMTPDREMSELQRIVKGFNETLGIFKTNLTEAGASLVEAKNSIYDLNTKIKKQEEDKLKLADQIKALEGKEDEESAKKLQELREAYDTIAKNQLDTQDELAKKQAEATEAREKLKRVNEEKRQENLGKMMAKAFTTFNDGVKSVMDKFMATQASMSYNLTGTGKTLGDVTDKLNSALNGRGIVRQEKVYEKLNALITSGIVFNAEQRAYLAAISEDFGLGFEVQSASLTRLINLQREDLTINRMAIQDSLKTFLNQNYQTSQYIKEGFQSVSDALLEAQSFMTSESAIQLESTVQKWIGSLSSLGLSGETSSSLAKAIGNLGSGNISALAGDKMQTLLILGATRSGDDYAEMLTSGVTAKTADSLLGGVVKYLTEVAGRESNVVKSAFTDILGISFSDLRAIANMAFTRSYPMGSLDTSGSNFLSRISDSIYLTTQLSNVLENLKWSAGTDIASSPAKYLTLKGTELISNMVGDILKGTTATISFFGNGMELDLGTIARTIPEVMLAAMSLPSAIQGLLNFNVGSNAATKIFNQLGGRNQKMVALSGNIFSPSTKQGTDSSGSVILNSGTDSTVEQAKTSGTTTAESMYTEEDEATIEKIYKLLGKEQAGGDSIHTVLSSILNTITELPNKTWAIAAQPRFAKVSIGSDGSGADDLLSYIALSYINIVNIKRLLEGIANTYGVSAALYRDSGEESFLDSLKDISNNF